MTDQKMPVLISTDWLAEHLDAPDIRILDASWHMPDAQQDAYADYLAAHIPGSIFFDINAISDPDSPYPHMLPLPEAFSLYMRKLGIGDGATVVVYDTGGLHAAARTWWMLRVFGLRDVMVLDGGLQKWRKEGRPLVDLPPGPRVRHFSARYHAPLVATCDDVQKASQMGEPQILDARSTERFKGEAEEPRPGLKKGHIPGSRNLPFDQLYKEDGTMKDPNILKTLFEEAGIDLKKPVIASCGSGVTACSLVLALEVLGHHNWSVYDGSWAEWGARKDLPVEAE